MKSTTLYVAAVALTTIRFSAAAQTQRPTGLTGALEPTKANTASADRTKGFALGVHTMGATGLKITGGDIDGSFATTFGAGAGVTLGYGFTHRLSAFASLDLAKQKTSPEDTPEGDWGLSHFEIGAKAHFPVGGATVPYVSASVGRRALAAHATDEEGNGSDVSITGQMFAFGGGIEHFFSPTMAFDAGVDVGMGKLNHFRSGEDTWNANVNGTTSIRMRLGITWRPGARRSS